METPKEEILRKMPYSELKKQAKDRGIKGNLKASALISLILEKGKNTEDSFVAMEQKIINSCKKNKQSKFDQDKQVGSDTPRRDTYTVECPTSDIVNKESKFNKDKQVASDTPRRETYTLERPTGDFAAINNDVVVSSASPALRKTPPTNETSFNVTMSRGSDRKFKKRKVSFITPLRKSARLGSMTPHFASVKDRPKTPIPSRSSSGKKLSPVKAKISFTETPSEVELKSSSSKGSAGRKGKRLSTPIPSSKCKRMNLSSSGLEAPIAIPELYSDQHEENKPEENKKSSLKEPVFKFSASPENKGIVASKLDTEKTSTPSSNLATRARIRTPRSNIKKVATPLSVNPKSVRTLTPRSNVKKVATPLAANPKNVRTLTPRSNIKKVATPLAANLKNIRTITPKSQAKKNVQLMNAKDKRTPRSCVKSATTPSSQVKAPPNFKELHQKAFDKMESIDEYQQRKAANSAKKLKQQLDNPVKSNASKKVVSNKKFGGIPFVPSVTSTKDMKLGAFSSGSHSVLGKSIASLNESVFTKKAKTQGSKKAVKSLENTPLKKKFRFDLKASLSKKLPYKPHKGPLKPLTENLNTSILNPAPVKPENKVVQAKRVESRNVVRGVRMNRRFELQMQKRKLGSS